MSDDIKKQHISSNERLKWNSHIGATGIKHHPLGNGTNPGFSTNDFTTMEKDKLNKYNNINRNAAYAVGDITFSGNLPTWVRLDCIKAGITGLVEPVWGTVAEGRTIIDGTVTWLVCDVKHALYA